MKIIHIGLVSSYTEGMKYQENYLPDINVERGHDVIFVTNSSKYEEGVLVDIPEGTKILENGLKLIRVKYDFVLFSLFSRKIQKVKTLKRILEDFSPDSIMYHGVCGYELLDVAEYVKTHPETLFYIDSHEDFSNTAKTWLSKMFYKYIHGYFVKKALPYANKILYIGEYSKIYLKEMYNIPDDKLEFYPLGGIITTEEEQGLDRKRLTEQYNIPDNAIIFMHSGKLDALKKTVELLSAFNSIENDNIFMFIFGAMPDETREEITRLIDENERISFLGWKSGDDIISLLNAADVYCQPGSPSATSQVALCCGCAEIVNPVISYTVMYEDDVLYVENTEQIKTQIEKLTDYETMLEYKKRGYERAKEILDYTKLAERYLY